ncbi:8-amino-7-oxononanoate synthase [Flavobacterium terrigena]|uniref:8-amino-7-oxononanoate synthase n=1 Tax=Flavobacterium terrigena TaxID=402734 RepID=UPI000B835FD6|nr:8-amino-7-oxononanoate synthase [Flavobacterium terrigena]
MEKITIKIFDTINDLPENWNAVASANHFLQLPYLKVLELSAPTNMQCFYIGFYENSELIGVSLAQYLDLNKLESFGERDNCFKTYIRNFIFRNFASHTLFLGNNMITGQNSFTFNKEINFQEVSTVLMQCSQELVAYFKQKGIKIHLVSFKDFYQDCAIEFKNHAFADVYEFNTQPNMIFELTSTWLSVEDYYNSFSKKYRDQYKRSHKKFDGILVKELEVEEVVFHEKRINELYHHVAKNAPFNTFFLAENHFSTFKKECGNGFKIFGYFLEDKLIGFHSVLLNDTVLETYFLGYDDHVQKEKMLYLNMLYNMTEFGITHQFKKIIFGRTALEIKSSIGATPVMMSGFIYHRNKVVNKFLGKIFKNLEPEAVWQQRHPFK